MVAVGGVIVYANGLCLLLAIIMTRSSSGFRAAFFRFADTDEPRFYLTEEEIKNAMKADDTWKIEAEDMNLFTLFKTLAVKIPAHEDMLGLEMEKYSWYLRNYACE